MLDRENPGENSNEDAASNTDISPDTPLPLGGAQDTAEGTAEGAAPAKKTARKAAAKRRRRRRPRRRRPPPS
ncbi:MAG: hypothetical protein ACXVXD_12350, partial [Nocardioidaceae bacterium]